MTTTPTTGSHPQTSSTSSTSGHNHTATMIHHEIHAGHNKYVKACHGGWLIEAPNFEYTRTTDTEKLFLEHLLEMLQALGEPTEPTTPTYPALEDYPHVNPTLYWTYNT